MNPREQKPPWTTTHTNVVHAWMCGHYGHMNVRHYAHLFDDASWAMWSLFGVSTRHMQQQGVRTVVASTNTTFVKELLPGTVVVVESRFVRLGTKSVTYEQRLLDVDTGQEHARQEATEVFVDDETRASTRIPTAIRALLA